VRRAFTLIEMLVATMLVAMLLGAVSLTVGGLARDERAIARRQNVARDERVLDLLRWDLMNAKSIAEGREGVTLIGHGGIDRGKLSATVRPSRVIYRVVQRGEGAGVLVREQSYLDDAIRPEKWSEIVAVGVNRIDIAAVPGAVGEMPARVRVRLEFEGRVVDQVIGTR
jgi:prepilin-type N-terminal cleavage/methylation domain-containing protein